MIQAAVQRIADNSRLVYLSARLIAWRWFWVAALVPLGWPAYLIMARGFGWMPEAYQPHEIPTGVIGLPLCILATALGVRIIAGDIERRTLEIAYTVPGGTHRVWFAKLTAAVLILVAAEALLAVVAAVFFSGYPLRVLYAPLQGAVFYLVLAMALSVLFKSEVTAALVSIPFLFLGFVLSSFSRLSPLYNTLAPDLVAQYDAGVIIARTVQNRIGYLLVIAALVALAFARAERREKMMS
jgi:hypothetical protein